MTTTAPPEPAELSAARERLAAVRSAIARVYVGQEELVEAVLRAALSGGHVLIESFPGLGKTLLVKALARVLGLDTRRIQFTPDLMPTDITGSHVFNTGERRFEFQPGPVFTQFLLADEINRSPAKTHAALLEAMQEGQVTLDGKRYPLKPPFLVLATQNPIESEGTYRLPEAGLDRFLVKMVLEYPDEAEEQRILRLHLAGGSPEQELGRLEPLLDAATIIGMQRLAARVPVAEPVIAYITAIVRATRAHPMLVLGASPRAAVALLALARAGALLEGRPYVVPDDVAETALPALRHRIVLAPEAEIEGRSADDVLREILRQVPAPRAV